MKVLVLATSLQSIGGIESYTRTLIKALKEIIGDRNVRVHSIWRDNAKGHTGGKLSLTVKIRFIVRSLIDAIWWRPDLIICTHIGLAPIGLVLNIILKRPYWVVTYGIEVWGILPLLKLHALREANKLVAISKFTKYRIVKRHKVADERIVILPCALEESMLATNDKSDRISCFAYNGHRLIITVGRLSRDEQYKGHDVVLRALPKVLKEIPDIKYVIVGDGDDRPRLESLAQELGVLDHVVFAGRVSNAELRAYYQNCEVFVMPAKTVLDDRSPKGEGFGIVFLEAMAFGKPVIGPNYGAPTEFIRHGEHGLLVNPESPEEVAEALIQLLSSPDLARQMGEAARQWVLQEYSYLRFRERLAEILNIVQKEEVS